MMKTLLLTLTLSAFFACRSFAQTSSNGTPSDIQTAKYDVLFDYSPTQFSGNDGYHIQSGFGVTGKWEIPIAHDLNLTLSDFEEEVYIRIADQNFYGYAPSYIFSIPKIGLKYALTKAIYIEGEAGYAVCSSTDFSSGGAFAIGGGFDFNLFELGMRYESWGNNGDIAQITFHAGFRF